MSIAEKFALISIPMRMISGLDRDVKAFLDLADFRPVLTLDPDDWDRDVLEWLYALCPIIVIQRGASRTRKSKTIVDAPESADAEPILRDDGAQQETVGVNAPQYHVLGSLLTWFLIEALCASEHELIPVRCIQATRIPKADKLNLIAAEFLALPALHRLGKPGPRLRHAIWEAFESVSSNPIKGNRLSDFHKATGTTFRG